MINTLLVAGASALVVVLIYVYTELKRVKIDKALCEDKLRIAEIQSKEFYIRTILLEAENNNLQNFVVSEKQSHSDHQKELKNHLELIGKNLIQQGSQVLRTENEQKLNALLNPLKERLQAFENEVKIANRQEIERFTSMETIVKALSEQHSKMHSTAQNLVDALRGDQKTQGDWGEMALERILETSGLEKNREYFIQNSFKDENNNQLRPDVIIQLPDNKHLIIDSKVSLKSFERYVNDDDEASRKTALTNHLISIKSHIKLLGEKDYSHLPGISSPDFVLMFIPLESSFSLAIKEEPNLYQLAWDKRVVLVTPSTLLATLKTVGSIWKQDRQNRHALEIAEQAGRLYDKFAGFIDDMERIGSKQKEATSAFDAAMNKLSTGNGNIIRSAEKLKEMGAKAKKTLDRKYNELNQNSVHEVDENQ
jgi:DNA recombination protein RmuC